VLSSEITPDLRFTAFSPTSQFAPRSKSTNTCRTLANSLPGQFAQWNFSSLAFSLTGTFGTRSELAREHLLPGTSALRSIRSQVHSLSGTCIPC